MHARRLGLSLLLSLLGVGLGGCDSGRVAPQRTEPEKHESTDVEHEIVEDDAREIGPPKVGKDVIRKARKAYLAKLNEGRGLTKSGEYAQALAVYREALAIEPDNAAVLGELGWAAFLSKDLPLAQRTTNMALRYSRKERQRGMLYYNLGRVAEEQGQTELAAEHYRASLVARPKNGTVEARLRSLDAKPEVDVARGIDFIARGLQSIDAVCTELKTRCDEIIMFGDSEDDCSCETVGTPVEWEDGGKPKMATLVRVGDGGDEWDGANFALHVVVTGKQGLDVTDFVAWTYNPGAFGIWESLSKPTLTAAQLLTGDPPELLIEFGKNRFDRDMGINEFENEAHEMVLVCGVLDGTPRCSRPLVRKYSYERDVEFEDGEFEDEQFEHTENLPIKQAFEASIEFQDGGTVKVRSHGEAGDNEFTGLRLPTGDHDLSDLW